MLDIHQRPGSATPDWVRCERCTGLVYGKRFVRALRVCPDCGGHSRLTAPHRLDQLIDPGSASPVHVEESAADPLRFTDTSPYQDRLRAARAATGLREAVVCVRCRIDGQPVVVAAMDFRFLGGSLGCQVGAYIAEAAYTSLRLRIPLLLVTASGGARMQEGALSLMQMAKTAQALAELDEAGILVVTLVTDPTYGGVAASFATLADVIIAEPGARLGFAGPRVIEQTTGERLPEGFQTAEFLREHGMVDEVVPRSGLRSTLGRLLALAQPPLAGGALPPTSAPAGTRAPEPGEGPPPEPVSRPDTGVRAARRPATATTAATTATVATPATTTAKAATITTGSGTATGDGTGTGDGRSDGKEQPLVGRPRHLLRRVDEVRERDPWDAVRLARHPERPTVLDYASHVLDDFQELHGDRLAEDCPAIVGGPGHLDGVPVMLIGHHKGGPTLGGRQRRLFGMPTPGGYRKAARLMRLAGKLGMPVVTLVDTPGANPGADAETQGQAVAIAENLRLMSRLPVPIVAVITGEGGSGGALALAVADRVLVSEGGIYSVISPEGCAAILWKDADQAPAAAAALRLDARELLRLGIVDGVVPEPPGGAHRDHAGAAALLGGALSETLHDLVPWEPDQLVRARRARFHRFGAEAESRTTRPGSTGHPEHAGRGAS